MNLLVAAVAFAALVGAAGVLAAPGGGGPQADAWPTAGSVVEYDLRSSFAAPDGSYARSTVAHLALAYSGTAWSGTCDATVTETVDGATSVISSSTASGGGPAVGPAGVRRGDMATLPLLSADTVAPLCRQGPLDAEVAGREHRDAAWSDARGRPVHVAAWVAQAPADGQPRDVDVAWSVRDGLVLGWSVSTASGSWGGVLVRTDAQMR